MNESTPLWIKVLLPATWYLYVLLSVILTLKLWSSLVEQLKDRKGAKSLPYPLWDLTVPEAQGTTVTSGPYDAVDKLLNECRFDAKTCSLTHATHCTARSILYFECKGYLSRTAGDAVAIGDATFRARSKELLDQIQTNPVHARICSIITEQHCAEILTLLTTILVAAVKRQKVVCRPSP